MILLDPYLSDQLAKKYAGKEFPHVRMMPAPVTAEELGRVDAVLCTHRHSDHMDPELLPEVAKRYPDCRFVIPRSELGSALGLGLPEERLLTMNAGDRRALVLAGEELVLEALPAAHEELKVNEHGEHHYLGYILRLGGLTIYHSGDCSPFEGLRGRLLGRGIDLALLPVNGRDPYRASRGILGNFTLEEACDLAGTRRFPA